MMNAELSDHELLREFLRSREERVLRELMERHLPLVYEAALRACGSEELAAEASQDVFIKLTGAPAILMKEDIPLIAWLHRTARHRALDLVRSERARKERERMAQEVSPALPAGDTDGLSKEALGMLDEVIDRLPALERELVLQRFFLGRSLAVIGQQKALSEDAVRMRLKRALEKMRGLFQVRGVTTSTALLATTLNGYAVSTAPVAVSAGVMKAAGGSAGAVSKLSISLIFQFMTTTQKTLAGASLLLAAGVLTVGIRSHKAPDEETKAPAVARPAEPGAAAGRPASAKDGPRLKTEREAAEHPELVEKYGESRTKLALHMAGDVVQFSSDTREIDQSPTFAQEQHDSRRWLLERLAERLSLRDEQKEALMQLSPEWDRLSSEQTAKLAEVARANPAAIAEAALAMDQWSEGKIGDEEFREIQARTAEKLAVDGRNVLELLGMQDRAGASGDPLEEVPELARKVEEMLDAEQAKIYREMKEKPSGDETVKKVSLEDMARGVEKSTKQTALWAESVRDGGR